MTSPAPLREKTSGKISAQGQGPAAGKAGFRLIILIALLLAIAFAFGGGGIRYGLANLIVQIAALAILAFHREAFFKFWKQSPLPLRILTGLTLLLPIAYLIPLPEAIWSALPGRDLVVQSYETAGVTGWSAASVDPARTLVALTGLIVPLVILSVGWTVPRRHLLTVGWFLAVLGLVCVALGVPQVLSGGTSLQLYDERAPAPLLLGTFANRNSTGIFLVSALAMAALLPLPLARPHPSALPFRLGLCALLLVGVVLTQSRTAFALAAIPVALGCIRALVVWRSTMKARRASGPDRSTAIIVGSIALGVIAVGGVLTLAPGRVGDTLERFETLDDPRTYIWDDATYSVERYWPMGAGMGTFDEVFQVDESLENLTQRRAGRAHNDYIELAIEAGIAGLALALAWLVLVGWLSWHAAASRFRWAAWASSAILLSIALQSITDYPLRNQAILAVAGFAMLMLARIASGDEQETRR